ncbi:hypothetical protein [Paenibacillus sp. DMB20]|uniref:hypothetical protein n=1 Tax=Paenibacillus sp. DMB20 TaxID=1642570 RepID=UPI00069A265D|nr:hypothetical protein [Paenibacillus sp. DMB20]
MRKHTRVADIEGLAKVLNMSPEEIMKGLHAGKTLAELAEQRGVNVQEVIDQQVKAVTEHLDRHLAEGRITKERYEEKKSKIKPFITDFVHGKHQKPKMHSRHRSISNVPDAGE